MSGSIRLALWTPLPPIRNGIADYSVELLAYLTHHFDVEIFIDTGYIPENVLHQRYKIFTYTTFADRHQADPFDIIIYQLGGSPDHHYMFSAIQKWPGLVVLHDLYMGLSLYRYYAKQGKANRKFARYLKDENIQAVQEFKALLRLHGAKHDLAVEQFFSTHYFLDWIVKSSLGQIVHMPYAAQQLKQRYPNAIPHVVTMGLKAETLDTEEQLRARFRIKPSTFVIGIFGKINKYKGYQLCIEAVRQLRSEYPDILMVIVGQQNQSEYVDRLQMVIDANGMRNHVHVAGYLTLPQFNQVLRICDAVVNLRFPGQMQMSATLVRALAAGVPVIISDIPEWNMIPDDACLRLAHGGNDVVILKEKLERLIVDPEFRANVVFNARRYVENHATPEIMSTQYQEIISQVMQTRSRNRFLTIADEKAQYFTSESPEQNNWSFLPVEEVSEARVHGLMRSWHKLQNADATISPIQPWTRLLTLVVNTLMRIRYIGTAWQLQSMLYEVFIQQHEFLNHKIEYLTEEIMLLKAELEKLQNELDK